MVNTAIEPRTFTEDQVSEALSAVVNENPKATNDRNVYFNHTTSQPRCMVGHVLNCLGVTHKDVRAAQCNDAKIERALQLLRITIPPQSQVMLTATQHESDRGRAWFFAASHGRLAATEWIASE